jgi:hypothetical protein
MSTTPTRYAVLHHSGVDEPHFDLLVEPSPKSDLWTWRCPTWPPTQGDRLKRLKDHRRLYLDYEGPIPGGNRGQVQKSDWGTCTLSVSHPGSITITFPTFTLRMREVEQGEWDIEQLEANHV